MGVKDLHPKVHGGLLFIRGNETHEAAIRTHNLQPIDLVVVTLSLRAKPSPSRT